MQFDFEAIKALFATPLIKMGDYTITVGDVAIVPCIILLGILLTRWATSLVASRMRKRGVAPDVVHLVSRLIYVFAIVILVITTLDFINIPITAFAFVSGAIAIGVGFGAQNIINNFISGWILMWERPIRIGDFLEVESAKGRVEAINTRSTRFRRTDGVHMLIPNSKLLENTVVNWTLKDKLIRTTVRVGVAYGSPARTVKTLIEQAVSESANVLQDPAPLVIFDDFGDNALMFEVYFWIEATVERDLRVIRSDIRFRIDELFSENNIVIAFPQRDVHVDGKLVVVNERENVTVQSHVTSERKE
ncbi:mechanosensitive ion channel [Aestuariibacter sp. AA17]|uniref:Mechanosensitive ion channel n=2 Tax=Fluctibacter corallii TaxID=2984329 RepID=A0ABT3A605_9ALTE|nr:mechanosensitive ion channel domain-containing protein [Aestuariibacter sp. AA17]MCV2884106.1 mechanosensitive ion channel [Aestuariibacter sp. AA17]